MSAPVLIVGAGMAGLACARALHRAGRSFQLFEAANAPGGRVRTDRTEDGFLLDHGFQVLLSAYPEVRRQVNLTQLRPKTFRSGAVIRLPDGKESVLRDPLRDPMALAATLRAPIGSLMDKARLALLAAKVLGANANDLLSDNSQSTLKFLRSEGWSDAMAERFFVPFFGGVFLDRSLCAPVGFFKFVFQQFALGRAMLPTSGMQQLPDQFVADLPTHCIHFGVSVTQISATGIKLSNGDQVEGSEVVLAVDGASAHRLLPAQSAPNNWNQTTCIYFGADASPGKGDGYLRLNATPNAVVHNVCFPSDISQDYAPKGNTLISVSIHGEQPLEHGTLLAKVREELAAWFGPRALIWRHIRTYTLPLALPQGPSKRPAARRLDGIYVCGDHTAYPSLNAALATGRLTAEAILNKH